MSNPWDIPPLPRKGDENHDEVHLGVGRVISQWEGVEFGLSRLHSIFVGQPDETDALRSYGAGRIFRDRMDTLKRSADAFFVKTPNQDTEGRCHQLFILIEGYSDRRNDIAHGIVFPVNELSFFRNILIDAKPSQFALIPPFHTLRKHDAAGDPAYAYTSVELFLLFSAFIDLTINLGNLRAHLRLGKPL